MADTTQSNLFINRLSINSHDVDVMQAVNVTIFESITSPVIMGSLTMRDYAGLRELGNLLPGQPVEIEWGIEGKPPVSAKFVLYGEEAAALDDSSSAQVSKFLFCSPWAIDGFCRQVSKPYKDKFIHEIVEDLLKTIEVTPGIIEPTKQKLNNFLPPLWTVPHTIKYLSGFAKNTEDRSGYVLWTDITTGNVNFTTLDYMLQGKLGKYPKELIWNTENLHYEGKVHKMSVEQSVDLIRFLNQGMQWNEVHAFNPDKKEAFKTKQKAIEYKAKHIGTKYPIPEKYLNSPKYKSVYYTTLFPSLDSPLTNTKDFEDFIEGELYSIYSNLFTDAFKINCWLDGESTRRAGWTCKLSYPSVDQSNGSKENTMYTGTYLIRNIVHVFQNNDYLQAATLVSDGFKEHPQPMMTWGA